MKKELIQSLTLATLLFIASKNALSNSHTAIEPCSAELFYTTPVPLPNKNGNQLPYLSKKIVGIENIHHITKPGKGIRVFYPEGSYDPGSMIRQKKPVGGAVFLSENPKGPTDCIYLHYKFLLAENFNFQKGGKLPGIYGGQPMSGGRKADGYNGFTVRITWDSNGHGSLYLYTPQNTSKFGSQLDSKKWQLNRFDANEITLLVKLNDTNEENGQIKVWHDKHLVSELNNIILRKTDSLKIEGMVFSSFFGGSNESYSTPNSTHIDFYDFSFSNAP